VVLPLATSARPGANAQLATNQGFHVWAAKLPRSIKQLHRRSGPTATDPGEHHQLAMK